MRVVLDHLNTHKLASLSAACEPAAARRMARMREWHDTPTQGRGLNMAALALRVLQPQGLDRRSPDDDPLKSASAAWEPQRNAEPATLDWRFAVTEARKKLKQL